MGRDKQGILYSGRGYHSRALLYLLVAKDFYNTISPMVPADANTGRLHCPRLALRIICMMGGGRDHWTR